MNPTSLRIRGLTAYADATLDLSDAPEGLIAIVGGNGSGKTTLLECLAPAPLFLGLPSRDGHLKDYARGRDAVIDLCFELGGSSFRSLVQIDTEYSAGRGKVEAFLYQDGEPLNDGKVKTYKEAVAEHLPSQSVFMASAFAAQNGAGGFVGLSVAARKELFGELLGLGKLQALAERAREHRKHADALLQRGAADYTRLDEDTEQLKHLRGVLKLRKASLEVSSQNLEKARAEAAEATKTLQELERVQEENQELATKLSAAREKRNTIKARLEAATGYLLDAERIERDHARAQELDTTLPTLRAELEAAKARKDELDAAQARADRDLANAKREVGRLVGVAEQVDRYRDELPELQLRVDELDHAAEGLDAVREGLRAETIELTGKIRAAEKVVREVQDALRSEEIALQQATRQAELLGQVPCEGRRLYEINLPDAGRVECGTCRFLTDAQAAAGELDGLQERITTRKSDLAEAAAYVAELRADGAALDARQQGLANAEAAQRQGQGTRDQLARLTSYLEANGAVTQQLDQARARQVEMAQRIVELAEQASANKARLSGLVPELRKLEEERRVYSGVDEAKTRLDVAREREPELREALGDAAIALSEIAEEHAKRQDVSDQLRFTRKQVADLEVSVKILEESAASRRREVGRVEGRIEAIGDLDKRRATLNTRDHELERRRAGFRLVEQGLGRNGVQALEIDAAGPEVSRLASELLEELAGPRWTVQLRTIQEASGGRKQKEVFDVQVFDGEDGGAPRDHGDLSGGEQVLVSEALMLGTAIFNASGTPLQTLWRDECDGALDPKIRPRYPAMLRAGMRLGGFRRCFFITHDPGVAAQADAILVPSSSGEMRLISPLDYTP